MIARFFPVSTGERFERLAWLAGGRGLMVALGFCSIVVMASFISPAEMGAWSIILAIQGYALQVSEHGIRTVVTAEAGRPDQTPRGLLPVYLGTRLSITALVYGCVCLATALLMPSWLNTVAVLMVSLFAIALFLDWIFLVEDRVINASILLIIRPVLFLFGILTLSHDLSIEWLAWLFAGSWIIAAMASWALPAQSNARKAPRITARRLIKMGRPVMGAQLISQAALNLDLLVVGAVLGLGAAGQYFLAASMATACLVIANAAGQIATARLGQSVDDRSLFQAEIKAESIQLGWIATLFCCLMALIAEPLVMIFFEDAYGPSAMLLVLMLPWLWLAHQSALLQAVLTVDRQRGALFEVSIQVAIALLVGLFAASIVAAAAAFALLRGGVEAYRVHRLCTWLDRETRQALQRALIRPAMVATIAIGGSLYLMAG